MGTSRYHPRMIHVVLPIVVAAVIPFSLSLAAKVGRFSRRDNHAQREWQAQLEGWRKRAYWAQANALETLPLFIGAVICAHLGHPGGTVPAAFAWSYPALRIAYTACYLDDVARPRTVVWMLSMVAILALYIGAIT